MKRHVLIIIVITLAVLLTTGVLWYFFRLKSSADVVSTWQPGLIELNHNDFNQESFENIEFWQANPGGYWPDDEYFQLTYEDQAQEKFFETGQVSLTGSDSSHALIDSQAAGSYWSDTITNPQPSIFPSGTSAEIKMCVSDYDGPDDEGYNDLYNQETMHPSNCAVFKPQIGLSGDTYNFKSTGGLLVGRYASLAITLSTSDLANTPKLRTVLDLTYYSEDAYLKKFAENLSKVVSIEKFVADCSSKKMEIYGLDSNGKSLLVGIVKINYGLRSMDYETAENYGLDIRKKFDDKDGASWAGLSDQYDAAYRDEIDYCFIESINDSNTTPTGGYEIWDKKYDPITQNPSSENGFMGPWVLAWGEPKRGLRIHGNITLGKALTRTNGCIRMENAYLEKIFDKVIVGETWLAIYE